LVAQHDRHLLVARRVHQTGIHPDGAVGHGGGVPLVGLHHPDAKRVGRDVRRPQSIDDLAGSIHVRPGLDDLADRYDLPAVGGLEHHLVLDPGLLGLVAGGDDLLLGVVGAVGLGLDLFGYQSAVGIAVALHFDLIADRNVEQGVGAAYFGPLSGND